MKKFLNLIMLVTAAALSAVSCTQKEDAMSDEVNAFVSFSLSGAAVVPQTDNMAAAPDECAVNHLWGLIFRSNIFVKAVSIERNGNTYYFKMDEAGDYTMFLVANADPDMLAEWQQLIPGESTVVDFTSIPITPDSGEEGAVLMLSDEVALSVADGDEELGDISVHRPALRIDKINAVENLSVDALILRDAVVRRTVSGYGDIGRETLKFGPFNSGASFETPDSNTSLTWIFPDEETEMIVSYTWNGVRDSVILSASGKHLAEDMIWGVRLYETDTLVVEEIVAEMQTGYEAGIERPVKDYVIGFFYEDLSYNNYMSEVTAKDNELNVSSVYAAIFTKGLLYSFTEAERISSTMFQVHVGESGSYSMILIANPDDTLVEHMTALKEGEAVVDDVMKTVVSAPVEAGSSLVMVSDEYWFYADNEGWNWQTDGVILNRLVSRIDIVNAVEGLEITDVVFRNMAASGTVGENFVELPSSLEDRTYTSFEGKGAYPGYLIFDGMIYSYENISSENPPSLIIDYTLNGKSGSREVDFSPFGGIWRNRLYSVVLSSDAVDARIKQEDWYYGYTPEFVEIQEEMNHALAVSRFMPTNVLSLDGGTVEFCQTQNSLPVGEPDASAFFKWEEGWSERVFVGIDGARYRIPSQAEMVLLFPEVTGIALTDVYDSQTLEEVLPDSIFGEYAGGTGSSEFYNSSNGQYYNQYALRFKGTPQYAAYRYSYVGNDRDDSYISVKVKALSEDSNPDIVMITDQSNPAYWESGCLEFRIPLTGSFGDVNETGEDALRGIAGALWVSDDSPVMLAMMVNPLSAESVHYSRISGDVSSFRANLRMVRVD